MRLDPHQVARALGGEVSGGQVLAPGPDHSPGDRSLSILIDDNAPGGFVLTSFAGDDAIACKDYVREKLGIPKWEPEKTAPPKERKVKSRDAYTYHDQDGLPYLQVKAVRYDDEGPKDFYQYHWQETDDGYSWKKGKPAGPKVPYGLPEILKNPDDLIFIVEGEKAVNALRKKGIIATTSSEGAGKWTADLDQWFHGRDVVVIPDNDAVGRKHAATICQHIPHAILLDLPDRAPKEGADDWLERHTKDELIALALDPPAPMAVPGEPESEMVGAKDADADGKRFTRERFQDIQPTSVEWLIKHFLPAQGVGILYGKSTVGKSFLVLDLCLKIATGQQFLNHRVRQAGVLYFAAEGQNGMRKRIKGVRDELGISAPAFQLIGDTLNLMDGDHVTALIEAAQDAKEDLAASNLPLGLIVIDTTSASMPGGNENAGEDMSVVLQAAQKVGAAAQCMVLFIAHPGKNEALGVRGWSGQGGNVDAVYYLAQDDTDPLLRVGVVQKLKDGEDGERFAYRLKQIPMGEDEDGEAITTAYPVYEDPPATSSARKKKRPEDRPGPAIIMRAVYQMMEAGQSRPAPSVPGVPTGQMAVFRRDIRERAMQLGYADQDDKPESVRRNVNRDLTYLIAANTLREDGELIWPLR